MYACGMEKLRAIARYVATASWGKNKFAVMAFDKRAYCVVAQTTREGAERYMKEGYVLVDLTKAKQRGIV